LNEQNNFEVVKNFEISRKILQNNRNMVSVDRENNAISRLTIVKVADKQSFMYMKLGEIRAMFKDTLFLWIKTALLSNSNGFYCTTSK
jgi:hypothetical protein